MALELTREQIEAGWTVQKLGDFCRSVDYGFTASATEEETGCKFLRITDIKTGYCDDTSVPNVKVTESEKIKYLLKPGDIVVARTGATTGVSAWLKNPEDMVFASYLVRFSVAPEHNSRFISYLLKTKIFKEYIHSVVSEKSAQPNASATTIALAELPIPPLDEQNRIAKILGSLDDKIEANNDLLNSLDGLGNALILQKINDVSETCQLSEVAEIVMGQSPAGATLNEDSEGLIFYQGRRDFGFRYPTPRVFTSAPTRLAEPGDILLSVRAPVGDLNRTDEECCVGRGVAAIRAKDGNTAQLFYLLKNIPSLWSPYEGEGTVFSSINRKQVQNLRVPVLDNFEEFEDIEQFILSLTQENLALAKTRNLLIRKLIG